jgi:hypothetical protein
MAQTAGSTAARLKAIPLLGAFEIAFPGAVAHSLFSADIIYG